MELRHLRYFLAVASTLSFTRAAAQLHLTQPTLSQQIRQLEQDVRTALFDRAGRRLRLTQAGVIFRQHAERALKEVASGTAALAELEGVMHGSLAIGVFQSFHSSLLPPILGEFSDRHPGVSVTVRQISTGDMEECLIKGELDLGIAFSPPASDRIVAERLFDEPMMLVVGNRHPLAGRREVQIRALRDHPLILLTPEFPSRKLLSERFAASGITPQIRFQANSADAILATVRCSRLATIQNERMAASIPGLHCVRLKPTVTRTVSIFWRRGGHRPAAARAVEEMIKKAHGRAATH